MSSKKQFSTQPSTPHSEGEKPHKMTTSKNLQVHKYNAFYLEVRPILFLFRLFARMTYEVQDGKLICRPRFISLVMWFIFYGVQFFVTIDLSMELTCHLKQEKSFLTSIVMSDTLIFIILHLFLPVSVVLESGKICSYVNNWVHLQEQFYKATGKKFIPKYSKILLLLVITTAFHDVTIIWIGRSILYSEKWYHLVLYFTIFYICHLNTLFWVISFLEMDHVASVITEELRAILKNLEGDSEITELRNLWSCLVELSADLGRALWRTMIVLMIVNFGSSVASVYAIINHFISGRPDILCFASALFSTGSAILLIVEPVHRAMLKVRHGVYQELMEIKIASVERASFLEIEKFLQVIKGINPHVTLGGFITIDRSLLTTIAGASVTYLIVLIQFRTSSENL